MNRKILQGFLILIAGILSMNSLTASSADAGAHQAHEAYVSAINSNNLGKLLPVLTEDVVFLALNASPLVGKVALKPWLLGYLKAYKTHWEKPVQKFIVSGEWAFERYAYTSTETPVGGGAVAKDTGWGLVIYHHDKDGKWGVACDAGVRIGLYRVNRRG